MANGCYYLNIQSQTFLGWLCLLIFRIQFIDILMSLHYDFSIYPRNVHVNKRLPDSTMKSHSIIRNSFKFGHQSALNPWTVCQLYRSRHYRAKPTLPIPPTTRLEPLPRPTLCRGQQHPCAWARRSNRCHRYAHCSLDCLCYDFCSSPGMGARTCVYWSTWGGTRMTTRLLVFWLRVGTVCVPTKNKYKSSKK